MKSSGSSEHTNETYQIWGDDVNEILFEIKKLLDEKDATPEHISIHLDFNLMTYDGYVIF